MEIKKAFEVFKKELAKETGIAGGFVMNRKQIANRTATYTVANTMTFESLIEMYKSSDAKVQAYTTWTADEKARAHESYMHSIETTTAKLEKYGTKENMARTERDTIANSKAFAKFESEVGKTTLTIEINSDQCFIIRFNY